MLRQLRLTARGVLRDSWRLPLHGGLHGDGGLGRCEHGEPRRDGHQLRDASPLHDDAWQRVPNDVPRCDGVLLLLWT